MKPVFQILSPQAVNRILEEAYQLLADTGVRISDPEACSLLENGGAKVDRHDRSDSRRNDRSRAFLGREGFLSPQSQRRTDRALFRR